MPHVLEPVTKLNKIMNDFILLFHTVCNFYSLENSLKCWLTFIKQNLTKPSKYTVIIYEVYKPSQNTVIIFDI